MSTPTQQTGNSIAQGFLPELDQELANTRKTLERIPDNKWGWKAHEKSSTLGWMAGHLANLAGWGAMTIQTDKLDVRPAGGPSFKLPAPATCEEALALFDQNAADFRKEVEGVSDAVMMQPWTLEAAGQTIFTMPKIAVLRGMIMNHIIHHRGQLTVYLRLNDIPVPALYGPSADEGKM
jgi:hypothetical protein